MIPIEIADKLAEACAEVERLESRSSSIAGPRSRIEEYIRLPCGHEGEDPRVRSLPPAKSEPTRGARSLD